MSLTFYYAPMSTATITEAVLAELGVSYDGVELDIENGETRTPDFLQINPNGRVPVIVHNGTAIWESIAITMYLGELVGVDAGLYPAPGPKRGDAMKWIAWSNTAIAEAAGRLSAALPVGADGAVQTGSADLVAAEQQSEREMEKAKADIAGYLALLDRELEDKDYLLGQYSLADTHLFVLILWLTMMEIDMADHAKVLAWKDRCSKRPALKKIFG